MNREEKYCRVCGRRMQWRRKWRHNWEQVLYCSKACRRIGLTEMDRTMEAAIVDLLDRQVGKRGIRVEAAAEALATVSTANRQQGLASAARNAARRLYNRGIIEILQNGQLVDPSHAKGPFRIRQRKAG